MFSFQTETKKDFLWDCSKVSKYVQYYKEFESMSHDDYKIKNESQLTNSIDI